MQWGLVCFTLCLPTFQGVAFLCPPACSPLECPALADSTCSPFRSWRGGYRLDAQSLTCLHVLNHHLPHYFNSLTHLPSTPVSVRTPSVTIENPTQTGSSMEGQRGVLQEA